MPPFGLQIPGPIGTLLGDAASIIGNALDGKGPTANTHNHRPPATTHNNPPANPTPPPPPPTTTPPAPTNPAPVNPTPPASSPDPTPTPTQPPASPSAIDGSAGNDPPNSVGAAPAGSAPSQPSGASPTDGGSGNGGSVSGGSGNGGTNEDTSLHSGSTGPLFSSLGKGGATLGNGGAGHSTSTPLIPGGGSNSPNAGSPFAGASAATSTGGHHTAAIIAGVLVPLFVILFGVAAYFAYKRRSRMRDRAEWERTHAEIADAVHHVGGPVTPAAWVRFPNANGSTARLGRDADADADPYGGLHTPVTAERGESLPFVHPNR